MFDPIIDWLNGKEEQLLGGDSNNARFVRSTFWLTASTIITLMLGMVSSIAVARMLDKTAFGEFGMIINTIAMLGTFAGLGLGLTSTKYVAEFKTKDPLKAARIMKLTNHLAVFSGGLVSILIFIFAEYISTRILNAPELSSKLRLGCVLLFLNTLNGTQTGALYGLESFKTVTKVNTIRGMINAPVLIAATYFFGLSGAVAGVVISGSAGWFLNHIALGAESRKINLPSDTGNIFSELDVLWKFSLPALLGGALTGPVIWIANTILANKPGGYGELGLINAANQWRNLITMLPSIFCSAALPILSSGGNSNAHDRDTLDLTQRITIAVILPLYTGTLFLGDVIMSFYGRSFAAGYPILVGITLAICIMAFSSTVATNLAATGKMWLGFLYNLAWGIVLISFVYLFCGRWGARAYAAGYLLSYLVLLTLVFLYSRKDLMKKTVTFTLFSVIYLLVVTSSALSMTPGTRIALSAPFMLLSAGLAALALGKDTMTKILCKIKGS